MLKEQLKKKDMDHFRSLANCADEFEKYVLQHTGDVYQSKLSRHMATGDHTALHALTKDHLKKYEDAARCYTEALAWLPEESSLYCNRSAAWYALDEMEKALDDAIKPSLLPAALTWGAARGHGTEHPAFRLSQSRPPHALYSFTTVVCF